MVHILQHTILYEKDCKIPTRISTSLIMKCGLIWKLSIIIAHLKYKLIKNHTQSKKHRFTDQSSKQTYETTSFLELVE